MKLLARTPFLLSMILLLPLWIVFNNFIVAAMVALLVAFLAAMCASLWLLRRSGSDRR